MPTIRREDRHRTGRPSWVIVLSILASHATLYWWATSSSSDASHPLLSSSFQPQHPFDPLAVPPGEAVALPSVPAGDDKIVRREYGGRGDKKHLGGFTDIDTEGISPRAWKWMVTKLNIRSVLDVGCGRGISTTWFLFHGLQPVLCVEGSADAKHRTMLPKPDEQMVQHDYSRGPWWPKDTYDAVWCVEFLEHVGRNFHHNYLPTFRKAGLIFVSHSIWGGWHHVETHTDRWWITKMELYGFRYSPFLTTAIRTVAWNETRAYATKGVAPNGKPIGAPHIHGRMLVFWNPAVTALPKHAHLFHYEPGCFVDRINDQHLVLRECGDGGGTEEEKAVETPLPEKFRPVTLTPDQDEKWFEWVKARVKPWKPPGNQR